MNFSKKIGTTSKWINNKGTKKINHLNFSKKIPRFNLKTSWSILTRKVKIVLSNRWHHRNCYLFFCPKFVNKLALPMWPIASWYIKYHLCKGFLSRRKKLWTEVNISSDEMGSKTIVSLLFHVIIISITLTGAEVCYNTGNFTANSTYAKNRDLVLRSLASNVTANGDFYNTTIGLGNDTVYGLVFCMASASAEICSSCVNSAIQTLMAACPNQKEAISWGGNPVPCIVHYANRYFLGSLELSPTDAGYNTGILDPSFRQFLQIWSGLMTDTVTIASTGSSRFKLAAETADLSSTQKIYVFMQCTPDVSPSNCRDCLQHSVDYYKSCCNGYQGGYAQKPNCVFRWDLYPFYNLFPQVTSPSPSSPPPTNTTIRKGWLISFSILKLFHLFHGFQFQLL